MTARNSHGGKNSRSVAAASAGMRRANSPAIRVGAYKEREPASLKDAQTRLVEACGGQVAASALCRVGKSQIHRYTDESDEHQFDHMPVDIVLVLERACGDAIVTRYLAAVQGHVLVDLSEAAKHQPYPAVLSRIGQETGELFAEATRALADGTLSASERPRVRAEALQLMGACAALLSDLGADLGPDPQEVP